jgi:signal transduction histidine kinase
MTLKSRIIRVRTLVGGTSGLSHRVIGGFAAMQFVLTFMYSIGNVDQHWLRTLVAAAAATAVSCGFLLVMRHVAYALGWQRPRLGLVVASLLAASMMRPIVSVAIIAGLPEAFSVTGESIGRRTAAVFSSMVVSIGLAAVVQVGRERGELMAALLAEQSRLLNLAATMEEDILRAESELRVEAIRLLEPTISEIRGMLDGELEPIEGARIAARIQQSVADVVRPVSRHLAVAPAVTPGGIHPVTPAPLNLLTDRMDVPGAMRPGWVFILSFLSMTPGLLLVGLPLIAWLVVVTSALALLAVLEFVRLLWPRSLRSMRIATGMATLFAVYLLGNLAYQLALTLSGAFDHGATTWATFTSLGLVLRVTIAMIVVVLAMLDEHRQRNQAALTQLNLELAGLVAKLRRETWLLHQSVSLAVHGPVQSALISTAMRLSAVPHAKGSVEDAKRRLDEALSAIERKRNDDGTVIDALRDLSDVWEGVAQIRYAIDPEARDLLAADSGLRACVIEVCREAASNAIRHGGAGEITITMTANSGRVEIRVRDDGRGVEPGAIAGLGSAMLDDICVHWQLSDLAGVGTDLVAVLA